MIVICLFLSLADSPLTEVKVTQIVMRATVASARYIAVEYEPWLT